MDYLKMLRLLTINDEQFVEGCISGAGPEGLDGKMRALVRLAALVAVGGAVPSYGVQADAAFNAGATATEIVEVLVAVVPVVGLPAVVSAAPNLALALGYDIGDAPAHQTPA